MVGDAADNVRAIGNGRASREPRLRTEGTRTGSTDVPVAVVSDGSRGLGLEIVRMLATQGIRVVLASPSAASGRAVLGSLGELADQVAVRELDVTDEGSVANLVLWLRMRLGRCDVLVNNTVPLVDDEPGTVDADLDTARLTMETGVLGTWRLSQAVVPLMRSRRHGRIVNVSGGGADAATMRRGNLPANLVAKAATNRLTQVMADELAADGILVNAYCAESAGVDADTPVWLATLPDEGPTGRVYPSFA